MSLMSSVTEVVTMSALWVALVLSAAGPVLYEPVPAPSEVEQTVALPPWEIFSGVVGGMRGAQVSPSAGLIIGVNRRVTSWLRPELLLGQGYSVNPRMHQTTLRVGTRLQWPSEGRWVAYLWIAFAHNHESAWDHFLAEPIATLFALSSHGSAHLTGAEAGLGISLELPKRASGRLAGRLNARVIVNRMWGTTIPFRVEGLLSIGTCF